MSNLDLKKVIIWKGYGYHNIYQLIFMDKKPIDIS